MVARKSPRPAPRFRKRPLAALVLGALLVPGPAFAQDAPADATIAQARGAEGLTERQHAILRLVLEADGFLNEDMHETFWSQENNDAIARLRTDITAGLTFQREVWRSAALSLEAATVTKTPAYALAARAAANAHLRAVTRTGTGGPARDADPLALADRLLDAAAKGGAYSASGTPVPLTQDRIAMALSSIEASLERAEGLLRPNWQRTERSRRFEDAGIALDWPVPFTLEIRRRIGADGASRATWALSARGDLQAFVIITVIEFSGPWRDPGAGLARLAREALASAGLPDATVSPRPWKSPDGTTRTGVAGSGSAMLSVPQSLPDEDGQSEDTTPLHAAIQVIDVAERRRAVSVLTLSTTSALDAKATLERVRGRLTLLAHTAGEDAGPGR